MAKPGKKSKSFFDMTDEERNESVKELDRESLFEESHPLTRKQTVLWELAKRLHGRPKLGTGAVKVPITLDPALLDRVDAYAKNNNLKRSQLITRVLSREVNAARPTSPARRSRVGVSPK